MAKLIEPIAMSFIKTFTATEIAEGFISRSTAKEHIEELPASGEVIIDFTGVDFIYPGYADELFRVWPLANPELILGIKTQSIEIKNMLTLVSKRSDLPQPLIPVVSR